MTDITKTIARAIYHSTGLEQGGSTHGNYDALSSVVKEIPDRMAQAALTAIKDAGYVIVPREPTTRMLVAGGTSIRRQGDIKVDTALGPYKAMISASQGEE